MRLISKRLVWLGLVFVLGMVGTRTSATKPMDTAIALHYIGVCTDTNEYSNSTSLTAVLLWSEDQFLNQECNQVVIDKVQ